MMYENGVVTKIEDHTATVALKAEPHEQCKSCGLCKASSDGRTMLAEMPATEGLHVGDRVRVDIPMPGRVFSATLLMLMPLIAFMAGLFLGEWLRSRHVIPGGSGVSVLLGLALMGACYLIAAAVDRRLRTAPDHRPRIVEDLQKEER